MHSVFSGLTTQRFGASKCFSPRQIPSDARLCVCPKTCPQQPSISFSLLLVGGPIYLLHPFMRLQLLTCMDSLTIENTGGKPVVVIGATNRPNDLDSALRRAGRFDREICLGVPDLAARARILQVLYCKQQRRRPTCADASLFCVS